MSIYIVFFYKKKKTDNNVLGLILITYLLPLYFHISEFYNLNKLNNKLNRSFYMETRFHRMLVHIH